MQVPGTRYFVFRTSYRDTASMQDPGTRVAASAGSWKLVAGFPTELLGTVQIRAIHDPASCHPTGK